MALLTSNDYGKCGVRLTKVLRGGGTQSLYEMRVDIRLGGAFERVYTAGDNSLCIPTDTMKNSVYALARTTSFDSPEAFGLILAEHFVDGFDQVAWAEVSIEQTLWDRIRVDGAPHPHAFVGYGSGRRTSSVRAERGRAAPSVRGGLSGLEVIKTSGSRFSGFLVDRFTTLRETEDRILATSIDAEWDFIGGQVDYNAVFEAAWLCIPRSFALHDSHSVQETIFAMGVALLDEVPAISSVGFSLPNRHRVAVSLEPFGLSGENDIFMATSEPFGLITGRVARE